MYTILANKKGSRKINVSDAHLETIQRYALLNNLIDSNGIVDEDVVEKLKLNARSIMENQKITDKSLLDLCLDVLYNTNMKAFGLGQLINLYYEWSNAHPETERKEE